MNFFVRWLAVVSLLSAAALASAAPADSLDVRLSLPEPVLSGDVDVVVNVTVTNTGQQAVSVLRWELPTVTHENAAFRITREGQPVAYLGRLIKRGPPDADDYLRIEAGATLSYAVELTSAYDIQRNGTYAIEVAGKGQFDAAGSALKSAPVYVWLQSRTDRSQAANPAPRLAAAPGERANISFTGNCSATRQTLLTQSIDAATSYAGNTVRYFASTRSATPRYRQWFGVETRERWNRVKANYTAIQDAFVNQPLTLDCSCTSSAYAYVFSNQPYKIYLCNAFWSAPMTGTDSKAGTMVHEMSHFTVVAGTNDFAYGQSACTALANSNPDNAVRNADSHEYFAENTPFQY